MLKHGVEAKTYKDPASTENVKPLDVKLRLMETLSDFSVQDFAYVRQREEQLHIKNGKHG